MFHSGRAYATTAESKWVQKFRFITIRLISKLAAWGHTREESIDRLRRALDEYEISGIKTTLPFFREIVRDEEFIAAVWTRVYFPFLRAT